MGIFEHFPYSNFHDLNLDRILERTKAAEAAAQAAEAATEAAAADMAAADAKATLALNTANSIDAKATLALNTANSVATEITPATITLANLLDTSKCSNVNTVSMAGGATKFGKLIIQKLVFRPLADNVNTNIGIKAEYCQSVELIPGLVFHDSNDPNGLNHFDTFDTSAVWANDRWSISPLPDGQNYCMIAITIAD